MNEQSKSPLLKFFNSIGEGDLEGALSTFHNEITLKANGPTSVPWYGVYTGKEGVRKFLQILSSNVETQVFKVNSVLAEEETIMASGFLKHRIPATDRLFESSWALLCKVKENLISYYEFFEDSSAAVEALKIR